MEGNILTLSNVTKSYGNKQILRGIDLTVTRGEIIGYIGPNGTGKSTTIKIILGMIDDYGGEVRLFGQNIKDSGLDYKRRIGYVPEIADVYDNLTGYEYLTFIGEMYGLSQDEAAHKSKTLMELFGVGEAYHSRISSYSKGMRQKLLIISSLLHNPDLLFLDEPINGLDANSVMIFKEILAQLAKQGKTIFYSSHLMDVVEKISSRIVLINEGHIVADGTFEQLQADSEGSSLEGIFNQLTGFDSYEEIGAQFVATVQGVV